MSGSAKLVSIQVGLPREVESGGKRVSTGIFKRPVEGRDDRPQQLVLLAKAKVVGNSHGYLLFGRPSTRSPRMLRWTWLVPPPMVLANEFR